MSLRWFLTLLYLLIVLFLFNFDLSSQQKRVFCCLLCLKRRYRNWIYIVDTGLTRCLKYHHHHHHLCTLPEQRHVLFPACNFSVSVIFRRLSSNKNQRIWSAWSTNFAFSFIQTFKRLPPHWNGKQAADWWHLCRENFTCRASNANQRQTSESNIVVYDRSRCRYGVVWFVQIVASEWLCLCVRTCVVPMTFPICQGRTAARSGSMGDRQWKIHRQDKKNTMYFRRL